MGDGEIEQEGKVESLGRRRRVSTPIAHDNSRGNTAGARGAGGAAEAEASASAVVGRRDRRGSKSDGVGGGSGKVRKSSLWNLFSVGAEYEL